MDLFIDIIKLTPDLLKQYSGIPSKQHRHKYEEIIIVSKGSPSHFIGFNTATFTAPLVIDVALGKRTIVHEQKIIYYINSNYRYGRRNNEN
ncbi:MAG: hypothetical protein WCI49_04710 [Ferruginibacter sp.]